MNKLEEGKALENTPNLLHTVKGNPYMIIIVHKVVKVASVLGKKDTKEDHAARRQTSLGHLTWNRNQASMHSQDAKPTNALQKNLREAPRRPHLTNLHRHNSTTVDETNKAIRDIRGPNDHTSAFEWSKDQSIAKRVFDLIDSVIGHNSWRRHGSGANPRRNRPQTL